jgi:hypothetical protein
MCVYRSTNTIVTCRMIAIMHAYTMILDALATRQNPSTLAYSLSVNKVSAVRLRDAKGRLSYKRGGEELKGKNKSENRRERGRSLNLQFHFYN